LGSNYIEQPTLADIQYWAISHLSSGTTINWTALDVSVVGLPAGQIKLIPKAGNLTYFGSITLTYTLL
jgi:hypothetical protein